MKQILHRAQLVPILGLTIVLGAFAFGEQEPSDCQRLPEPLRLELAKRFPDSKIEDTTDLAAEYREMWTRAHGSECPGIVAAKFKGGQRKVFAVLLVSTHRHEPGAKLVLVDPGASGDSRFRVLDTVNGATSSPNVIYALPPGPYSDPEGIKKVQAPYDVVALEQLEVGSIVYFYRGGAFHKLIISE